MLKKKKRKDFIAISTMDYTRKTGDQQCKTFELNTKNNVICFFIIQHSDTEQMTDKAVVINIIFGRKNMT